MINSDLITDAYRAAGIVADGESATAVQMQVGLRKLNQMLAEEAENGLSFASWYSQTSLADTLPLPEYAESWVTAQLSVILSGEFRVPVSEVQAGKAATGRATIERKRFNQALQPVYPNIPAGESDWNTYSILNG